MSIRRAPPDRWLAVAYRPVVAAQTWIVTGYLLVSGLVGAFWVAVLAAGIGAGVGLALVYVGLPLLAALPLAWRQGARLERRVVGTVFATTITPAYRMAPNATLLRRARIVVADPATWKDLAYLVLLFPLGTIWTALVALVWGHALSLATLPLYFYALDGRTVDWLVFGNVAFAADSWWKVSVACLVGLLLTAPAAWIVKGAGRLHLALAQLLLGASQSQALAAEALRLRESRDRVIEAAAAERRKIERDLHDGAQQRLIALVMDLSIAKSKFKTNPAAAEPLVDRAHEEAKRAITELRDLARGLHPAMLTERGLDAALSGIAGRSPVPVDIRIDLDRSLNAEIERTLYFVIAEALTNIAKHACATRAWVTVKLDDSEGQVRLGIRDDGVGGASMNPGGGLEGLRNRVATVGGTLDVSSPLGGPTSITAEVPCA